jgi:Ca2+-binding RTX toxin-like protein
MTDLTVYDQLLLELVNRARLDPVTEANRLGIGLNADLPFAIIDGSAKQPLAPDELLSTAASDHSLWMLDTDTFSHQGVGGSSPGDRMTAAGYVFTGSWTWGENIAWSGTTGTPNVEAYTKQLHDNLFRSAGHRVNLLDDTYREVGIGVESGAFTSGGTTFNSVMATENFATSGSDVYVTGVVITDADGDNFYDIGEARAGIWVSVSAGGVVAGTDDTGTAGGYAVSAAGGTLDVQFSGGDLLSSVSVTVEAGARNAKVDLLGASEILSSANTTLGLGAIDLVLLGVAALSGTGNDSANHLVGNRAANVLAGAGGNDTLTGGAGRDVLTGGEGADWFDFNARSETARTMSTADVITDFARGLDRIDLAGIDARTTASGNQAFRWLGSGAFTGSAGQLRYQKYDQAGTDHDVTMVMGDVNGDKKVDFAIVLTGLHGLSSADFVL